MPSEMTTASAAATKKSVADDPLRPGRDARVTAQVLDAERLSGLPSGARLAGACRGQGRPEGPDPGTRVRPSTAVGREEVRATAYSAPMPWPRPTRRAWPRAPRRRGRHSRPRRRWRCPRRRGRSRPTERWPGCLQAVERGIDEEGAAERVRAVGDGGGVGQDAAVAGVDAHDLDRITGLAGVGQAHEAGRGRELRDALDDDVVVGRADVVGRHGVAGTGLARRAPRRCPASASSMNES